LTRDGVQAGVLAERPLRLNVSWTFAGNMIYAGCQWGMLVALAKLGSPEMVGRFALALAITAPVYMLTNLQLRAVEATDMTDQFAFGDYLGLRMVCTGMALAVIAGIAAFSRYPLMIAAVIVVVGVAKGAESISDAIYGLAQRHERMDLIAGSMVLKGVVSLAAFALAIALTRSLVIGVSALAMAWCVVLATYDFGLARKFAVAGLGQEVERAFAPHFSTGRLAHLARLSLPLGITATLGSLTYNVPRYFVERYVGTRALGFFAAIASLMVVGTLVTNAIGQSASPRLASRHASGDTPAFRTLLFRLSAASAVPGVLGVLIAALAGKPLLRLVYRADYERYSNVLTLLMVAAAIFCAASILEYGLTAARLIKAQPALFAATVLVSGVACHFLVPARGLEGAALALTSAAATQLAGAILVLLPVL
jgi:O-antigen/teichoic acid export membrane protein